MIAVDVETGGIDPKKTALLSIGAVDMNDPQRTFYGECKAADGLEVTAGALKVNGFTMEQCFDEEKMHESELLDAFFTWVAGCFADPVMLAHNAAFDLGFINAAAERNGLKSPFGFRSVDIHSVYYYHLKKKGVPIPKRLSLNAILTDLFGKKEPDPHNALTGAKCNAEVMSYLLGNDMGKLYDDFLV